MRYTIRRARPEDAPAIAHVHVASWRSTYAGIMDDDFLARLSVESREGMWREILSAAGHPTTVHVAEAAGGDVVGFVAAGPERERDPHHRGEVYAIYLLENEQGHGIGRRLWEAAVAELKNRDLPGALVWVLRDNPSRGFYEAIGGNYLREKEITVGDQTFPEVAYGWPP